MINSILHYEEANAYIASCDQEKQYLLSNALVCFLRTVQQNPDAYLGDWDMLLYIKSIEETFKNKIFIQDVWDGNGKKYDWWDDDE